MNRQIRITRRAFLAGLPLAALALHSDALLAQSDSATALVRTPSGPLRGVASRGVRVFRGVPFAEPPVGPLRFKPPVNVRPWSDERDATKFAAAAWQPGSSEHARSEDCLYLNVWAPEGPGPFPVFVWIHGGGLTIGSATGELYDRAPFAREGIVVVTVAYRLGVFGFLDLSKHLGADYPGGANNGVRDLVAALQWVQNNIASFGGDPNRVTIGGQSAGAKLTGILMGVPSALPLFHQMISESGGAERVAPQGASFEASEGFAREWSKRTGSDVASLLTAPPATIIEAQGSFLHTWPEHFPLRCEIDETLIPRMPMVSIAAGNTRGKRLLIGTNRDESAAFLGSSETRDVRATDLGNMPLEAFRQVLSRYPGLYPQLSQKQLLVRAVSAEEYWVPSVRTADAHVKGGGDAWMYRFDFTENGGKYPGYAYHGLELGMVWGKPHTEVTNADAESDLGKKLHSAWVAFLRGDLPSGTGLPDWHEYASTSRSTLIIDTDSHVEQLPQERELRLWYGVI